MCDASGKVERANGAAKRFFDGISPSANLLSLLYGQYTASITIEELTSPAKHKVFELMRPGSERFKVLYLQATVDFVINPEGAVNSIVFVFRDFTEEKIEQTMKQDFLGLISHKLKTPIAVLTSGLSMIQDGVIGPVNDKQKEYVGKMSSKIRSLNGLVDKLFAFVTIERDKLDLPNEDVVVKDRLKTLVKAVAMIDHGKKVDVTVDVSAKTPAAKINGTYFDLVVGNLIENAIKFNDKDVVKVDIKVVTHEGRVAVTIIDNGCGIPPEDREKIFDKFYQIEKLFTGNVEGNGLGLALVKRIVEAYGGDVKVESDLGKGSILSFTLPA